jgi:hypothetical protein
VGRAVHEQRVREKPAAQRDLPQDDQLLPLRVGTGDLRRAFRSVVSTAKANGASVYDTIRFVLSTKRNVEVMARVG